MSGSFVTRGVIITALFSVFYQLVLRDVFAILGVGRQLQTLSDFPYTCRRLNDPDFEACEDMWYDDSTAKLYLACSTTRNRKHWLPNMGKLDLAPDPQLDRIVQVDVEKPVVDSGTTTTYKHKILRMVNLNSKFAALSITGKKTTKTTTTAPKEDSLALTQFYLINNKPSLPVLSGVEADNKKTGANSTIELFEHMPGSDSLQHIRTFSHPLIQTPNNVAIAKDGGFFFSNDHGLYKTGIMHPLSVFTHTGNIVHCKATIPTECAIVSTSHSFPNGVLIPDTHPNLLFVASAGITGKIRIYNILAPPPLSSSSPGNKDKGHPYLKLIQTIKTTMPIDNLSWDQTTKSIYAAGIPKAFQTTKCFFDHTDDFQTSSPSTVFRIFEEKNLVDGAKWVALKVFEDDKGNVLPACTTAVRDGKGRIWTSGVLSPFISVCEPKKRIGR